MTKQTQKINTQIGSRLTNSAGIFSLISIMEYSNVLGERYISNRNFFLDKSIAPLKQEYYKWEIVKLENMLVLYYNIYINYMIASWYIY